MNLTMTVVACLLVQIARADEPVRVEFDGPHDLIVLEAMIRDQGPYRFFLDSGATSTVLDIEVAEALGFDLGSQATRQSTAAGSQVTIAPVTGGVDFVFAPDLEVHVNQVIAAPFGAVTEVMVGERYDGILGWATFQQFVIEVDYEDRSVTFHEPATYRYEGDGTVLALEFPPGHPRLPFIRANLVNGENELVNYLLAVDSGGQTMSAASVGTKAEWTSFMTPANRVVESLGATGLSNQAEGTTHDLFMTRVDSLKIGPYEIERPLINCSTGGTSFGTVGAAFLRRFHVVFDYPRFRLILEPNEDYVSEQKIDRSGVTIVSSDDGRFSVWFVAAGTPGAEAGLERDDIVVSIDGVASETIGLVRAREMFCETGRYELVVSRGGARVSTVLATRPLYD